VVGLLLIKVLIMITLSTKRFVLEYASHFIEVESVEVGFSHVAKLLIDGKQVDEEKAVSERATLPVGNITVLVQWSWTGSVVKCVLIEGDEEIPLEPKVVASWIMLLIDGIFSRLVNDPEFKPLEQRPTLQLMLSRFVQTEPRERSDSKKPKPGKQKVVS
jgi:hypothetical protein